VGVALEELGAKAAPAFGNVPSSSTFAIAVMLYFLLVGFLYGYVWVRVNVARAFRWADLDALGTRVAREVKSAIDQQGQTDAQALSLLSRQLSPAAGETPVDENELKAAIRAASAPVKVVAFQQARAFRKDNPGDKQRLAIPIFKALVESAPGQFHRNYAQLGYLYKDRPNPDWAEAERYLTEAIRLRGPADQAGYALYEFNRAVCRIHLDPAFAEKKPSAPEVKAQVVQDLQVVEENSGIADTLLTNQEIAEWMALNKVERKDLQPSQT
jgi:hypothetical protein